jgi:hypothetical protein
MMMSAEYLNQVKEHLYNGLAIIDLAGHVEDPGTLWRRDSLAYAMHLVFREWQAAHALLSRLEDELPGEQPCGAPPNRTVPLEPAPGA